MASFPFITSFPSMDAADAFFAATYDSLYAACSLYLKRRGLRYIVDVGIPAENHEEYVAGMARDRIK
jgi:hypothetical protein